jgi:hypothetical protein
MLHQDAQNAERVVGEVRLLGVRVPEADDVLALVIQRRARFEPLVARRLSVVVDQRSKAARSDTGGFRFAGEDIGILLPELGSAELMHKLLRRPAAALEVQAVALPVYMLWGVHALPWRMSILSKSSRPSADVSNLDPP